MSQAGGLDDPRGAWSGEETVEFLRETPIPLRLACRRPNGGLWMLSLWYRYREGTLTCATAADADVVRFLRESDEVAFEISTNRPPYRGVRGAGTASIEPDEDKAVLSALVDRYLGGRDSELASWLLAPDREEVVIEVSVDRAFTWDYGDRMKDVESRNGAE